MARSKALSTPKPSNTSLTLIDQELANEVVNIKSQIGAPSGNKIKIEAGGSFVLPDGTNLGNEMQVVVLDFVTRHSFYSSVYNPSAPAPPDCYAMGKDIGSLEPESDSPVMQHDGKCAACPLNQFGSGVGGKSKACKNERLLAVLVVDPDNPDAHNDPNAPIYALSLSPTNLKSFDGAVNTVARMLNAPPIKAILTATAQNVGTYAAVTFSDPVPNPNYAAHAARRAECQDMLFRRPDFAAAAARQPAAPSRRQAPANAPRRVAGARR